MKILKLEKIIKLHLYEEKKMVYDIPIFFLMDYMQYLYWEFLNPL